MSLSSATLPSVSISDTFDGGNIEFVSQHPVEEDGSTMLQVNLRIKSDPYTQLEQLAHMQYFSFRVMIHSEEVEVVKKIKYVLENAHAVSYPEAWSGTTVCYTDNINDVDSWKRNLDTFYLDGKLSWEHQHDDDSGAVVYFSYFAPFSYARHLDLISKCCTNSNATVTSLGQTLEGREIECVQIGTGATVCWIIHRQHPGETMAEHYAEGLLEKLLGMNQEEEDVTFREQALELYTFYIVPCMCPDGGVKGHLRTNACGANLNREWCSKGDYEAPTLERSPEVYHVLEKMQSTGVDIFLDIHGDEELPFNFLSGANHVPNWSMRLQSLHGAFAAAYQRANSDMQLPIGYPPPSDPQEVLQYMNIATNQVCYKFDCLALTLEMPFKDCLSNSNPEFGWTPARARALGASVLEPLLYVHPFLRAEGNFWTALPPEDAYVETTDDYEQHQQPPEGEFKMLKKRFYSDVHEIHKR